jgi:uncharacterized membrane protein YciS (DUF1049 family)
MSSESFKVWLESQGWYDYFNWLLAQPSDPFMSAMFLIGIVFAVGLVLVIFMGTGENRDEDRFKRDHRIYKDNRKIDK